MGNIYFPCLIPLGNCICINSPTILPAAAPTLKTGMKLPEGTGIVDEIMENINCKNKSNGIRIRVKLRR